MRPPLGLTERELEILLLGSEGHTDKEIARRLGVAVTTITTHWVRMRDKLGASSRGQVIAKVLPVMFRESQEELMLVNARYRVLVETLEEFAVFMIDKERRVLSWNPGVGRILGFEEEEWIGEVADVIFRPEERAEGAPEQEQTTAEREGRAGDHRWHVRKNGELFWSSGVLVPIRNPNGETFCYCKVLQDLTRLKRMEDQVRALGGTVSS